MTARTSSLRALRRIAVVVAILSLGACSPVGRSRAPIVFVPDARLYEQIAEVEHVTGLSVHYSNSFGSGPVYDGDVQVDDTANLLCVADQVNAILWQGRGANISVEVEQGEKYVGSPELGLNTSALVDDVEWQKWIERYGPHPMATTAPKPSPRPTPPPGGPCG